MKNIIFCCAANAELNFHLDDVVIEMQRASSYFENALFSYVYSSVHHHHAIAVYESSFSEKELLESFENYLKIFEPSF